MTGRTGTSRGGRTRDRLVAATIGLLEEGGYANASVGAITGSAGVAAGTLYRHFPSKEELFVEVFRDVCGREYAAMSGAAQSSGSALTRLDAVVAVFAERAMQNPRLAWSLLAEPVDPLVDAERLEFRRRYRDLIATLLADGVAAGEFADQDVRLTAAALVGAIGDALVGPLSPPGTQDGRGEDAELIAELQTFCRRAVGG